MNLLENLRPLKRDMERKGWVIDSFIFKYKDTKYIVLIKLYEKNENKPQYALVKMKFLKTNNHTDSLEIPAHSNGLMIDAKQFRDYFGIKYSNNLRDILNQFSQYLGSFIPMEVLDNKDQEQKRAMISSLCEKDSEKSLRIYCYKVKRNPNREDGSPGQRSFYNDNLTRILRPELYEELGKDRTLSFCYSIDAADEKSTPEILKNWVNKKRQ